MLKLQAIWSILLIILCDKKLCNNCPPLAVEGFNNINMDSVTVNIINITYMIFQSISTKLFYILSWQQEPHMKKRDLLGRCHLEIMKYIWWIYLPHFPLAVHVISPLALRYWCKMHIQLLSFKVRCLLQRFRTIII